MKKYHFSISIVLIYAILMWNLPILKVQPIINQSVPKQLIVESINEEIEPTVQVEEVQTERQNPIIVSRGGSRETHISYYMDLNEKTQLTKEDIDKVLDNTKLEGLSQAYVDAEDNYGINALFLLSLSIHESGWGKSTLAQTKNNLFRFQAYDHNVNKAKYFNIKEECIDYVAKYIKDNYLTSTGRYYNGVTIYAINKLYASDKNWSTKVYDTMNILLERMRG